MDIKVRDEKIAKWRKDLEWIKMKEWAQLSSGRKVYRRVAEIVRSNPEIHKPNLFYDWMEINYAVSTTVGIRRILDDHGKNLKGRKQPVSLTHLIDDICTNASFITRDWFKSLYHIESMRKFGYADRDFDIYAGENGNSLKPEILANKLTDLNSIAKGTIAYVDKIAAHSDRKQPNGLTYDEVNKVIDKIGELIRDVELLLNASFLRNPEVAILADWEWIFRQPWIPQETNKPPSNNR